MKHKNYSLTPFWDKSVMDSKTQQSRVMLTINLNRKQFRITLKLRCTKAEFDAALSSRSMNVRELRRELNDYVNKAEKILERLVAPTKESFTRLFKSETDLFNSNKTDVFYFYKTKIQDLKKEGRIGSANYYLQCEHLLRTFKSSVAFEDIDNVFLKQYQKYLIERGNSISTVAIRFRSLRTIFNLAIKQGFISEKHYPFKHFKMPSTSKSKSVLYPQQLKALYEYVPKTLTEERAKDYFFFCFLCNGMNFKDMAYLKWKHVNKDTIHFVRQKTQFTSNDVNEIQVHLHENAKVILDKWGNQNKDPDAYVFPILPKSASAEYLESARNIKKRAINKSLTQIGKQLGFDFHITLNLARHSFATTLKLNGTHVSFISEMMGHTSMKTTMHYLKTIPGDELKAVSDSLLKF